jgi:ComF family protein
MVEDTEIRAVPAWPAALARAARGAVRGLVDIVLPVRCLKCGVPVAETGTLCPSCWGNLAFITAPLCACCGLPFAFAAPGDSRCAACIATPPPFARARAALVYDEGSRGLILAFKHGDRTDLAPVFGRWLARAGAELLPGADLLVPVPLHRWRLFRRRYNQAAMLAYAVARESPVRVVPDLLLRHRATPSQGGLGRRGRARNVAGAFSLHRRARRQAEGRNVLLIDDVHTTGATLAECAKLLHRAGAARVEVLTLARVAALDS